MYGSIIIEACLEGLLSTRAYAHIPKPLLAQQVLPNLVYGSIMSEDCEELTLHHFGHIVPLAQAGLDYMMFQANSTGSALVSLCVCVCVCACLQ